ncbi:MAG: hypothetical protein NT075_04515, partial [Chloroflexi bacterium]|nr:hypothetical protein [Chloroflexota bacterium]
SLTHSWLGVAGWLASFGASLATMAVTTVASVLFPAPINLESTSRQSAFSGGCWTALANTLLVPIVIGLACAPLAALFAAAFWWRLEWLAALGVVVALLYGGGLFWLGARQAERLMLTREAEILVATNQAET